MKTSATLIAGAARSVIFDRNFSDPSPSLSPIPDISGADYLGQELTFAKAPFGPYRHFRDWS